MKLFGLEDRNGTKFSINIEKINKEYHIMAIDSLYKQDTPEPQPEFKVGDWVMTKYTDLIYRIENKEGSYYTGNVRGSGYKSQALRYATPQEIEQHLRKICEDKYIGKKAKSFSSDFVSGKLRINHWKGYYPNEDEYYMVHTLGGEPTGFCVYQQGKFAEIVPDKKPLPKTKEELKDFLFSYSQVFSKSKLADTLSTFLNDYED